MGGPGSGPKRSGNGGGHRKGNVKVNLTAVFTGGKSRVIRSVSAVKSRKVSVSGKARGTGGKGRTGVGHQV